MRIITASALIVATILSVCAQMPAASCASQFLSGEQLIAQGRRIYLDGILPDGTPLHAAGASGIISGKEVTCVSCHRHSGLGASEGGIRIPAVAGQILFAPRTQTREQLKNNRLAGAGARPAYTIEALRTAIVRGINVNGETLDPLMPRFELSRQATDALIAYLQTLDTTPAPGVTDTQIHLGTVVGPDVSEAQRKSMLDTLHAYFHDYNAQTRNEKKRSEHAPWHKSWQYESYKEIELHVLQLQGHADTWHDQLMAFYSAQPVYAFINGISSLPWQPIHAFCEQEKIPCLFPTVDLPDTTAPGRYSIYFSAGMALEAKALARHLNDLPAGTTQRLVQVYRAEARKQSAAQLLAQYSKTTPIDISVAAGEAVADNFWVNVLTTTNPSILALWLDENDLSSLAAVLSKQKVQPQIYLSGSLIEDVNLLPPGIGKHTYIVSRYTPQSDRQQQLARLNYWAKHRNIPLDNERIVANAYFAATKTSAAIRRTRAYLTRDYLLEQFEHMLENNVFTSVYPRLSLGPEQRFASKGCYLIGPFTPPLSSQQQVAKKWLVP